MTSGTVQAPIKPYTILTDHIMSQAPSCAHGVWMGFCKVLTMVPGTPEMLHGVGYF